jgi:hypothetical protein
MTSACSEMEVEDEEWRVLDSDELQAHIKKQAQEARERVILEQKKRLGLWWYSQYKHHSEVVEQYIPYDIAKHDPVPNSIVRLDTIATMLENIPLELSLRDHWNLVTGIEKDYAHECFENLRRRQYNILAQRWQLLQTSMATRIELMPRICALKTKKRMTALCTQKKRKKKKKQQQSWGSNDLNSWSVSNDQVSNSWCSLWGAWGDLEEKVTPNKIN